MSDRRLCGRRCAAEEFFSNPLLPAFDYCEKSVNNAVVFAAAESAPRLNVASSRIFPTSISNVIVRASFFQTATHKQANAQGNTPHNQETYHAP
ncbi:MAG TPA: hypothetical protein VEY11_02345 [Pyrinomonadaceae bacterium]|nr:hypothetical protein [Pyrinomonadaceae bacterium]